MFIKPISLDKTLRINFTANDRDRLSNVTVGADEIFFAGAGKLSVKKD